MHYFDISKDVGGVALQQSYAVTHTQPSQFNINTFCDLVPVLAVWEFLFRH